MKSGSGERRSNATALIRAVVAKSREPVRALSDKQARTRDNKNEDRIQAYRYRRELQSSLMKARTLLKSSAIESFFKVLKQQTLFEENRFSRQPVGHDSMSLMEEPTKMSLRSEIIWLSHRAVFFADRISPYLDARKSIQDLLLVDKYEDSLKALAEVESKYGVSIWSTSIQIALRQRLGGDESQKSYLTTIKQFHKGGMLRYLSILYSQRAEESVSIAWYLENTRRRLDRLKPSDLTDYAVYKAMSEWPESQDSVASILRIEQNHHEFDIYDTLVSALQHLSTLSLSDGLRDAITEAISRLSILNDFRLLKLRVCFDMTVEASEMPVSENRGLSELLAGDVKSAYRASLESVATNPDSVYERFVLALVTSSRSGSKPQTANGQIVTDINRGLADSVRGTMGTEDFTNRDREWIRKFGHVFEALPMAQSMGFLSDAESARDLTAFNKRIFSASLNTPYVSPFDIVGSVGRPNSIATIRRLLQPSLATSFAEMLSGLSSSVDGLHPDVVSLAESSVALSNNNFDDVEHRIEKALQADSRVIAAHGVMIALDAYAREGELSKAATLISNEHAIHGAEISTLAITPVFDGVKWVDIRPHASQMSMSIALFLYEQEAGTDIAHTHRCFALQTFLQSRGITKPSSLRASASEFNPGELRFFLGKVCDKSVLDMLPSIASSREVLEERRDICALIIQLYGSGGEYEQELLEISRELTVQQGLQAIDRSRVHIDIISLKAIARRELSESFSRYQALNKVKPGSTDTFDSVLRDLSKKETQGKYLLFVPESEADELLISMIAQTRQRFLFDPHHGLDSYLSKRVRHGSVVGYLRAPVEKEGMITQQNSNGSYAKNAKWSSQVAMTNRGAELERALASFSKTFDATLVRLKDVLLHVRSESHPLGVFDASLSAPMYHLIRTVANKDISLENFIETIFASLRGMLNPSLQVATNTLNKETSSIVAEQFDALRATVNSILPHSTERTEMDTAAGRAATSAQAAIESVAAWFQPVKPEDTQYWMSDVVAIAMASVQAISSDFDPDMQVNDQANLKVDAANMLVITDVLFVIFGNIAQRSNVSSRPKVWVDIELDEDASLVRIKVDNEIVLSTSLSDARERMEARKRKLLDKEGSEMVRRDDGSGFFKLASIVGQSENASLDFGYKSSERFFVHVELSLSSLVKDIHENSDS